MSERRYKIGANRRQGMLMPPSIEDYVSETNLVRAIDAYVDSLDMTDLGFAYTDAGSELGGQPAYPPAAMLKLYLYGYENKIRSSRMLEREAGRNVELMWLLQGFTPSHTAIANFRKDNLKALKNVNREFVRLCRKLGLFGREEVSIDGTFIRGNASKASIHSQEKLERQQSKLGQEIEKIEKYFTELEKNDRSERDKPSEDPQLGQKLEKLKEHQAKTKACLEKLAESGATQVSETDGDARLLKKNGQVVAGFNVQIAVDKKHKLICAHDVVNDGNDTQQLAPMAEKAKAVLEVETLKANADAGYANVQQIKECLDNGITPYVPLPDKNAQTRAEGRFERAEFSYNKESDCYQCPAGNMLKRSGSQKKGNKQSYKYAAKASVCKACPLAEKCLPEKTGYRQIYRWEYEEIIEQHRQRMIKSGRAQMLTRGSCAEHPFGTLKESLGWRQFLMRGLDKVRAEMDLQVLSYNFKRVLNILGITAFKFCLKQRVMA